ncbi:MAG: MerR family transcriptional regulator [Chloroflexi bacterium]|nr:MerR family transcriptional regulator [Ktedonobacteraceae bacterium]MBV9020958.1 MerR family transcriptional regulator [Ktedonobacteraceae bacterium]MBV9708877.1 MerR family transcriptional regulator [Chloroflexota bacterium]
MTEQQRPLRVQKIRVTSYYSEQEIVEYSRLEVQVVRHLCDVGVVGGINVASEERRYSDEDLAQLRRVRRLYEDMGVNLEGIEIIMRLAARVEALQGELAAYKGMAAPMQQEKASNDASRQKEQQ